MNSLTTAQLKKLIADHSLSENLKALLQQSQIISELASKLRKQANKLVREDLERPNSILKIFRAVKNSQALSPRN